MYQGARGKMPNARLRCAYAALILAGVATVTAGAQQVCASGQCLTGEGYAVHIMGFTGERTPDASDSPLARKNQHRVDVGGEFVVRLPGGGQLWATEDAATIDPRMAVHAGPTFTVDNGRVTAPVEFFIYKNYDAFIDQAMLDIYDGADFDRLEPVVSLPIPDGNFVRVVWNGQVDRAINLGDEFYYRARALDTNKRLDQTREKTITAISVNDVDVVKRVALSRDDGLGPDGNGAGDTTTPLNGKVLIMSPPLATMRNETLSYTLTPRFDTRKIIVKDKDKAELERIIEDWQGATDVKLVSAGHTDNVRIAPQNRHEFANNQVLSVARAASVARYLAERMGLEPEQITLEGWGQQRPVADNATSDGRAQNRRVEVSITGNRVTTEVSRNTAITLYDPVLKNMVPVGAGGLDAAVAMLDKVAGKVTPRIAGDRAPVTCLEVQSYGHELQALYGSNELVERNIPIRGSRVRLHARSVSGSSALRINQHMVPIDAHGKFAVDYVMPIGDHEFNVEMLNEECAVFESATVPVNVSGKHMFIVALADFTASDSKLSGSVEPLAVNDHFDDDFLVDGRVAFYLKGKVRGKYLVTAQLDTLEDEIGNMLENLSDKDPRRIFRRLDPDRYYPVYGDDSTTIMDTDSIGKMYLRADWDNSHAVWGNFHTGLTGTELAQYNRSLYGGQLDWHSTAVRDNGESQTEVNLFVSENQTELGHSEFVGTGGSLYYLKHNDVLPGSEKLRIELRDRDNDRVLENIALTRGVDYEVDEIQGRIILTRPLMQIMPLQTPSLIKDAPIDGNRAILVADYEYIPAGFSADHIGTGGRGKHWFGDHLGIGVTYAQENRGGGANDYQLAGVDVTLQKAPNTFLNVEFASSEEQQVERYLSNNGGLMFTTLAGTTTAGREGDAYAIEARVNSTEWLETENEWVMGAWYRHSDAGFSVARRDAGVEIDEYGGEIVGTVGDDLTLSGRASVVERGAQQDDRRFSLQVDYALSERSELSAELRRVDVDTNGVFPGGQVNGFNRRLPGDGTLAAMRFTRRLGDRLTAYAGGQVSLDQGPTYDNNDMVTAGVVARVGGRTNMSLEVNSGHRGDGSTLTLDHELNHRHRIYGSYTHSTDRTDTYANEQIALGQRTVFSNRLAVFNEHQFVEYQRNEAGIAHVFGLDWTPVDGWSLGGTFQTGELDTGRELIDRDAVSGSLSYMGDKVRISTRLELRQDDGRNTDQEQWVSANRIDYRYSMNTRLLARFNFSETEDTLNPAFDAKFTEAQIGIAYRPVDNSRFNMLAKYTYLYDLRGFEQQASSTDQRSNILSVEGIYLLNPRWDIGGKYVYRQGELRTGRGTGDWFESSARFFALRGRYHLIRDWDAMAEYRWLDVDEAQSTRNGYLVSLDRHFGDSFKLGLGYNFTDFSDDLTKLDYEYKGWFVNAVGKY